MLCRMELLPQLLVPHKIVIGLTFKLSKFLNPLKFSNEIFSSILFFKIIFFAVQSSLSYTLDTSNNSCGAGIEPSLGWLLTSMSIHSGKSPIAHPTVSHHKTPIAIAPRFLPPQQPSPPTRVLRIIPLQKSLQFLLQILSPFSR